MGKGVVVVGGGAVVADGAVVEGVELGDR
jgi:hypothetical protein